MPSPQELDAPATADAGPDDLALVDRLREEDAEAADLLVARYTRPLLHYLRRVVGSPHVAEELHQATWLSVLEHLDRFRPQPKADPTGGFRPWLFRIATNKAKDHFRRTGRQRVHTGRMAIDPAFQAPPEAHDGLDAEEQHARLREAINELPEPQREVVLLRYFGGLKFTEIAETVGCPLNTALGRMHKAMGKLKTALGGAE